MNNKPEKGQGSQAGVPGRDAEQDERSAQPDQIDPSIDVDIIDDEGDEQGDSRQAGSERQPGAGKFAPDQKRK